ncbi:helix-turn-helix domain-containing protein [Chryseobacterium indologenes]|uniref:helix-turn-helix domain-containing protein n=1 Tax=Chryseobacterium TaxID=59732 RepID=UPI0016282725|nr:MULTISPECIES: helix-turn-helix domain-containing protein [Chryseobacterium]MDM1553612.1 helix-turn-helix domain-containing protein [Chryseobacterium indologenes]WET48417.1 helix-turn-helix domain-containing protein [Chryseobacterium indologenes]
MEKKIPNYKRIYTDIILEKYPEKFETCRTILNKNFLSALDVIKLNKMIFGFEDVRVKEFNQKHRSYDELTILEILKFQKENGYNNSQTAIQFKISRNSLAKWKKIFPLQ